MEISTKLYINIKTGEISIEGSEEFVSKQIENIENIVSLIQIELPSGEHQQEADKNTSKTSEPASESSNTVNKSNGELKVPPVFGEWLQMFRDDINQQDKALITAFYEQQGSESNDVKTSQINKSLKDHGIKLTNASATLKDIENKKLIFQTRKVGKLSFKRVSEDGIKHLKSITR